MKLSELINRLEEIKGSEGDMDMAYYNSIEDKYVPVISALMSVEKTEVVNNDTEVSGYIETDLALFIG